MPHLNMPFAEGLISPHNTELVCVDLDIKEHFSAGSSQGCRHKGTKDKAISSLLVSAPEAK